MRWVIDPKGGLRRNETVSRVKAKCIWKSESKIERNGRAKGQSVTAHGYCWRNYTEGTVETRMINNLKGRNSWIIREFTIQKNLDDDAASSWSRRVLNASYKMNLRNLEHTRVRLEVRLAGNFGANLEISEFRQQSESAWLFLSYRSYKNAFISGK